MTIIAAQEIKRRGIGIVDEQAAKGPVFVVKNNKPHYVVLALDDYNAMLEELDAARLAASKADLAAGRYNKGTAQELMKLLLSE